METLPAPPDSVIGQIAAGVIFAITVLSLTGVAIERYFAKRREAHPDDVRRSDTLELIDSARIRNELERIIDGLFGGEGKPPGLAAKMDHVLADLQILKNREEAARFAREEVARLLLEERSRKD